MIDLVVVFVSFILCLYWLSGRFCLVEFSYYSFSVNEHLYKRRMYVKQNIHENIQSSFYFLTVPTIQ